MNLTRTYKTIWQFRELMEPHWATPPPPDAIRYAITEAAEAMDVYLRQTRQEDARNKEREGDLYAELADCLLMLLTAMGPHHASVYVANHHEMSGSIDALCYHVADAALHLNVMPVERIGNRLFWAAVQEAVTLLVNWPGWDWRDALALRLLAIYQHHHPNAYELDAHMPVITELFGWQAELLPRGEKD